MRTLGLIVSLLMLSGCATILKSSTEKIALDSNIPKSKVYINSKYMGVTPLVLELNPEQNLAVEFRKDGYESKSVVLTKGVGGGWVVLDVVFGLVPVIVDAGTGKWQGFDQKSVMVELEPRVAKSSAIPGEKKAD